MRWTQEQYMDYSLRRAKAGAERVCAAKPERPERVSLDCVVQRKGKSCPRFKILFTVYARRPLDWDNYRFKDLQDCIVRAGIIPGDEWNLLEGSVRSEKVHEESEEKTVVEITEA